MPLIDIKDLSLAFGGPPLLDGIGLQVERSERVGLLGRNGEGKTTLLRLLAGSSAPDSGQIIRLPGLRVGMLPQEVPSDIGGTIHEVVAGGFAAAGLPQLDHARLHVVDETITRANLDAGADFATLSTGRRRRTLLARAMVVEPDLLLLDEPTNHLDIDAITWLEGALRRFPGAIVFVTHDRAFLRALADRILELDRGRLRDWACGYDDFLKRRDAQLRAELEQAAQFDRKLAEEELWIRKGVQARRTRNEGRVRALMRLREERRARRELTGSARLALQDAERTGKLVIRVKNLNFAWEERAIVRGLTTRIVRGDKIGILGPNGSGKTTLLRLLLGELPPDGGEVVHGTNLQVAYYDQQRAQLDEGRSVQDNITGGNDTVIFNGNPLHIVTYLKHFLFSADRARAPVSRLSGGERNRLMLARLFARPANVLVLDEPTNDLDLETVELLEELLVEFTGTLLLISHDRDFLDNVTTSTLVLEGEGRVSECVGGYSDWARTAQAAAAVSAGAEVRKKPERPRTEKPKSERPRRLSWKERQELDALPARIEALEAEQAELHRRLGDPAFYQNAGESVGAATLRVAAVEEELAALLARWEALASLEE